ncbi:peptide ABC transporter substrate-binding protein [Spirochaetia bacterium]|nr:peptide ABC transporter substrate-binding protein [Spirochaetia bacterium]
MKRVFKVGLLLLAAGILLSACGNGGGSKTAAAPQQVFRIALEQDIETIDPQQNTAKYTTTICEGINEALLREHNGEVLPGAAESYDTDDFITWTFHLRRDATWSDGTPITANDFVYSYKEIFHRPECAKVYILFEGVKNYSAIAAAMAAGKSGSELRNVTDTLGVSAPDPYTLVVQLDSPRPYFEEMFSSTAWSPIKKDIYEANGKAYGSSPDKIGMNGPFVLSSWKYNEELILEPNPNYWNRSGITLNRVEVKIVKDIEPRVNMFKEGSVDFIVSSSESYNTLKDYLLVAPGSADYYLLLNYLRRDANGRVVNKAISDLIANRNFVNALSCAIDRTVLFTQVLESPAFRGTGWIMPEYINLNNDNRDEIGVVRRGTSIHPVKLDQARAKQYLQAAMTELGYSAPSQIPEISIVVASSADPRTIVEYLELSLEQELGIKIKVDPVEFNVRDSRIISGDYDLLYMGWGISNNDPLSYLDVWADDLFATGWPEASPGTYNAFADLVGKITIGTDMNIRAEQILEAERIALDNAPLIPLAFSSEVGLIQHNITGFNLRMFNAPYDYIYASVK